MLTLRRSYGIIPERNCIRNYILRADRLYFNNDVFSCAMMHLLHLDDETLSEKRISFITLILRMIT